MFEDRPKHYCAEPGCPEQLAHGAGPRCAAHRKEHDRYRSVERPVKLLFGHADWRRRTRAQMVSLNPICQRVIDGVRCTRPTAEVHHLIGSERSVAENVFHDWRFLASVCESHNPSSSEDDWGVYVPTIWKTPMSADPIPEPIAQPGEHLKPEQARQLWSLPERLEYLRHKKETQD